MSRFDQAFLQIDTMTTVLEKPRFVPTGITGPLSESIIPAVPGKFYAYAPIFTDSKPLFALLDCKANKSRKLADAGELGREVHLFFEFVGDLVRVSSVKMAQATGLLGHISAEFDDVWVAPASIEIEDFYTLCAQRDSAKLAHICKGACHKRKESINVTPGLVIAVMTSAGKYALFLVKEVSPKSVSIDACHALLT